MQGRALKLDALRSSHPIQVPIAKAEEVEQVFDAISYCKGGSVVRMVHAVVGEECFTRGLRNYMTAFKFGNATTDDLWSAWEVRRHHLHYRHHHLPHLHHHRRLHHRRRAASRSRR